VCWNLLVYECVCFGVCWCVSVCVLLFFGCVILCLLEFVVE